MSTMFKKNPNVFVSVILFFVLNLETCCGNYDCYQMSSGKDICFMFDRTERTFEVSKQFCQNNGGFLLEIYNEEMQKFVENFGRKNNLIFKEVWLNLLQTDTNVWLWGGKGSGIYMLYSNWESPPTYFITFNNAVLVNNYKWISTYDPGQASTICIQGSRELYLSRTYAPFAITIELGTTTTTRAWIGTTGFYRWTTSYWMMTTKTTTTTTTTKAPNIVPTKATVPAYIYSVNSDSLSPTALAIGVGLGVGLGGSVLIIVLSFLIFKFVFHKEIPLPFKSWRNRNSPPHETRSDVINSGSEHIDVKRLENRSPNAEVIMSDAEAPPPYSTMDIGFKYLIQPNSASGLQGPPTVDRGPSLAETFGKNVYDNARN